MRFALAKRPQLKAWIPPACIPEFYNHIFLRVSTKPRSPVFFFSCGSVPSKRAAQRVAPPRALPSFRLFFLLPIGRFAFLQRSRLCVFLWFLDRRAVWITDALPSAII